MTKAKSAFLALLAVLLSPMVANADLITFDFEITAIEGSAFGTFAGDDLNLDGFFSAAEISFFEATATGTAFTGGPYTIDPFEAVVRDFLLELSTLEWSVLSVDNGVAYGNAGHEGLCYQSATCFFTGLYVNFSLNYSVSGRLLESIWITQVPEPGTLTLLGIGLLGMGLVRRQKA